MPQARIGSTVRTVQLEVLRADGWETITFEGIEQLRVADAPGEEGMVFTLIGQRPDAPNQIATGVLDVADRHEALLDSAVPTLDGQSLPLALRDRNGEG